MQISTAFNFSTDTGYENSLPNVPKRDIFELNIPKNKNDAGSVKFIAREPFQERGTKMRVRCFLIGMAVLSIAGMLTASSYAKVGIEDCIGMWQFDEGNSAKDSSGNGNDGELMGDPQWVDGKFGKAFDFDGVDDYVDLPPFPRQTNAPLSFTAWINWRGSTATTRGIWGYVNTPAAECHFEIQAAGMRLRLNSLNQTGMTTPPDNEWVFMAFTYDGDTAIYYLNGVEDSSFSGDSGETFGDEFAPGHVLAVSDAGRFFDGILDEAALFSVALTADDVGNIMNSGLSRTLGLTAVELSGKLATTWADIKAQRESVD